MDSSSGSGFDIIFDDEETLTDLDSINNQNAMAVQVDDPLFKKFKQWARSRDVDDNTKEGLVESFRFYLVDCDSLTCRTSNFRIFEDYARGHCDEGTEVSGELLESVIRLYGVDEDGKSACCIVRGFRPAFYARTSKQMEDSEVETLTGQLNSAILKTLKYSGSFASFVNNKTPAILKIEKLDNCRGVSGLDSPEESGPLEGSLLKITCSLTMLVKEAAKILTSKAEESIFASNGFKVYETDLKPTVRYMATQAVPCCSWIEAKRAIVVSQQNEESRISYTDLIVCCDYQNIRALSTDKEPQKIPKLRVLSLDIEIFDPALYKDKDAEFPKPGTEDVKVVQIGNILRTLGDRGDEAELQVIFALGSTDPVEHAENFLFDSEEEMLMAWRLFVLLVDPDILTGYNLHVFDITFLLERAKVLGLKNFPYFGKCVSTAMGYQEVPPDKKAPNFINYQANYIAKCTGRVVFDMITIIRNEYPHGMKPSGGWKLGEVSLELLNDKKKPIEHWHIPHLYVAGAFFRCELAEYCLQDAMLAMKLMLNLPNGRSECFFEQYCEKAKRLGCLLRLVSTRSKPYLDGIVTLRAVKKGTL